MREQEKSITLLGNQGTKYPQDYAPEVLETFVNKHPDNDYFVKFNCPEFTSLCPITGQPVCIDHDIVRTGRTNGREQILKIIFV